MGRSKKNSVNCEYVITEMKSHLGEAARADYYCNERQGVAGVEINRIKDGNDSRNYMP